MDICFPWRITVVSWLLVGRGDDIPPVDGDAFLAYAQKLSTSVDSFPPATQFAA
jgi:hypothetical protein